MSGMSGMDGMSGMSGMGGMSGMSNIAPPPAAPAPKYADAVATPTPVWYSSGAPAPAEDPPASGMSNIVPMGNR